MIISFVALKDFDPGQIEVDVSFSTSQWRGSMANSQIFLKFLDFTSITSKRPASMFSKVDNWFVRNRVTGTTVVPHVAGDIKHDIFCDTVLVHDFYVFLLKLCRTGDARYRWLKVAEDSKECREVEADERVSRDFMNRLDHLMRALLSGRLSLKSAKHHCFFMDSSQVLLMLQVFTEINHNNIYSKCKEADLQQYILHKTKNVHDYFDKMEDVALLRESESGVLHYDWRVRLAGPADELVETELQKLVRKSRDENMKRMTGASGSSFHTYGTPGTFYKPDSPCSLVMLIRNLRVHWATVCMMVRREICYRSMTQPIVIEVDDEFLYFWTSRFPNLVTTIYNVMSSFGLNPPGGIHHSVMNTFLYVQRKGINNYNADENPTRRFSHDGCIDAVPNFTLLPLQQVLGWFCPSSSP